MEKYNDKQINDQTCTKHNNKYLCFCFNCNKHLCNKCLKERIHINHIKNNILEVEPEEDELNIILEMIKYYNNKIENLKSEKKEKVKKLKFY